MPILKQRIYVSKNGQQTSLRFSIFNIIDLKNKYSSCIGQQQNHQLNNKMNYSELKNQIPKKSIQWTVADVLKWLKFIQLQKYCPIFQKKSINGDMLKKMDASTLVNEIGIQSKIVCKKLLNCDIVGIRNGLQQFDTFIQEPTQPSEPSPAQSLQPTQNNNYTQFSPIECAQDLKKSLKKKSEHTLLLLKRSELRQNFWYEIKQKDYRIGSDENCQIEINGDHIQPFHAQICYRSGAYYLRNVSQDAGVYFKVNARLPIVYGMRVEMGSNIFQFSKNEQNNLVIKTAQGKNPNQTFTFKNVDKISIGRKQTNDISFPNDITLSNLHARLTYSDSIWYIEDLATTNGSWILLEEEVKVYTGFTFKLGLTNIQLECELKQVKEEQEGQARQQISIIYLKKQKEVCVICEKNGKDLLFMPCNHCAVCEHCGVGVKYCVVCSQKVVTTAKIYKS